MAVREEFHSRSKIDDKRAALLTEYQQEDVYFKMLEEEQNMVETVTTQLYNTAEYNRRMNEADKEIRRGIGQRMTKKKTLIVGVIAFVSYLIGFIPLFVSNANDEKSLSTSLIFIAIAVSTFLFCGFICLYSLRIL